jgi:hypothetical protein
MNKVSQFLTDHWKAIVLFYIVVNSYTRIDNEQIAIAKRVDRIEIIQSEIQEIKIMVERIDERTGGKNGKQKNFR